jgi:16S rRNA (cytidine1402-2'-O)-methyltransferase
MHQKGEFVLMLHGSEKQTESDEVESTTQELLTILLEELPVKQAATLAAKITGKKKNELYRQAMVIKSSD